VAQRQWPYFILFNYITHLLRPFSKQGGPFVVPGYGRAQELGLLVKLGLSPHEAPRAATANAAVWLGEQDQRGTPVPGKAADPVLLDANPLENIANIGRVRGVVPNGRWVPVAQLLPTQP